MPYEIGIGIARSEGLNVICCDHDKCTHSTCCHKRPHKYAWAVCDCDCQGEVKSCLPIEVVTVDKEVAL